MQRIPRNGLSIPSEAQEVWKVVQTVSNRYFSADVYFPDQRLVDYGMRNSLEYIIGMLHYDDVGVGFFCYSSLEIARKAICGTFKGKRDCKVLKGSAWEANTREGMRGSFYTRDYDNNPLVRMNYFLPTEVVPDEPKEEWVDVTIGCEVEASTCSAGYIYISHKGKSVGAVGLLPFAPFDSTNYRVDPRAKIYSPSITTGRIMKRIAR